jgi:hypothetical protein
MTSTDMERLVHLLNEVNNSDITPRDYLDESHHSAIPLIKSLLEQVLITPGGNLDWDKKDELEALGYRAFPVEQDSWGWVIGAVATDTGAITFG